MCCTGHLPTVQAAYSATGSTSKTHYPRRVAISDASASPAGSGRSSKPPAIQNARPTSFPPSAAILNARGRRARLRSRILGGDAGSLLAGQLMSVLLDSASAFRPSASCR